MSRLSVLIIHRLLVVLDLLGLYRLLVHRLLVHRLLVQYLLVLLRELAALSLPQQSRHKSSSCQDLN